MIKELSKLIIQRLENRKKLNKLSRNYLVLIYSLLVKRKNLKDIHKELFKKTMESSIIDKAAYVYSYKLATSLDKKTKRIENKADIALIVLNEYDKRHSIDKLEHLNNSLLLDNEQKRKEEIFKNEFENNRNEKADDVEKKIFYLCSKHDDCAIDHKPFQGLMYIDEEWEKLIKSKEVKEEVKKYLQKHRIKTIQEIMGKPVYLITRPYCRHYFVGLSLKEVSENSLTKLLKIHNASLKVGIRGELQTPKVSNTENVLRVYQERLDFHESLYREYPNDFLKKAIEKDKMLIKKWREYLQSIK